MSLKNGNLFESNSTRTFLHTKQDALSLSRKEKVVNCHLV